MLVNQFGYPVYNYFLNRVFISDGHCKKEVGSLANFTYKKYPHWQENSYFKPLEVSSLGKGEKTSFEGIPVTNLYTSKL